jgi:hypothetical protein
LFPYLNPNLIIVPESIGGNFDSLVRAAKCRFGFLLSIATEVPFADFRETETGASGLAKHMAQSKGKLSGIETVLSVLCCLLVFLTVYGIHVDFGRITLLRRLVIVCRKEEPCQPDLLIASVQACILPRLDTRQEIRLESVKVIGLSALTTKDSVL